MVSALGRRKIPGLLPTAGGSGCLVECEEDLSYGLWYTKGMKVFLDDQRTTPNGWVRTYWPDEVITLLKTGNVTYLSLDHDLGDDSRGTGYDVILWIEEAVATQGFTPPVIAVHSSNGPARDRMLAGVAAIQRLHGKQNPP